MRAQPSLARVAALLDEGRTATTAHEPVRAERLLRAALADLDRLTPEDGHADLRGRVLVTLALTVCEQGRLPEAHALLDDATMALGPDGGVLIHGQRAILLRRSGRDDLALVEYSLALDAVNGQTDPADIARIRVNRAVLHLAAAQPALARADLQESLRISRRLNLPIFVAIAEHNLAVVEALRGDVPAALRGFAEAEKAYSASEFAGILPTLSLDRARLLMGVGLVTEASRDLDNAIKGLRRQHLTQDLGEALLSRAECRALLGDVAGARTSARQARTTFRTRSNARWAGRADLLLARLDPRPTSSTRSLAQSQEQLVRLQLWEEARLAAYELVRRNPAVELTLEAPKRTDRLETRVAWRAARAARHEAAGRWRAAFAELRTGLAAVAAVRARLGSSDLRASTALVGVDLANAGLRLALVDQRPSDVLEWVERGRAQALLHPPVVTADDSMSVDLLAELRSVRQALADNGAPRELRSRAHRLESALRDRQWQVSGPPTTVEVVDVDEVRHALGAEQALVTFVEAGPDLLALVLTDDVSGLIRLGSAEPIVERARRLRATLDVRAGRTMKGLLSATIDRTLAAEAEMIDGALLQPVAALIGGRDVVIVAAGELAMIPWSVLPSTKGRPTTVSPSATVWARGVPAAPKGAPPTASLLLAAGPRLDGADAEIEAIARVRPAADIVQGNAATAAAVLDRLPRVATAHLAAHGTHNADHPAFSGLELAGGPLMGYDLGRVANLPELVILSACDLGRHEPRPGGESLGMTTSLLTGGTRSVIAGVCRAGDTETIDLMTALHSGLAAGIGPARALGEATRATGLAHPFVCFGHGG